MKRDGDFHVWLCAAAIGLLTLVAMVLQLGAPLALAGIGMVGLLTLMLFKTDVAVVTFAFLLYLNIAAVAVQRWGVPEAVTGVVILLPLAIPLVRRLSMQKESPRGDRVFVLMLAFLIVLLMSSFVAVDHAVAMRRVVSFMAEGLVIYWLILNVVRRLDTWRRVAWAIVLAGALLSSLSSFQALTHNYTQQFGGLARRELSFEFDDSPPGVREGGVVRLKDRAQGPLDDSNRYAQILLVLFPIALFLWRREQQRSYRALALAAASAILCGILLTYSRGALVGLLVVCVLLLCMGYVRLKHCLVGGIIVAMICVAVAPGIFERLSRLRGSEHMMSGNVAGSKDGDRVARGRLTEMLSALMAFRDHVVLGVGPGQYMPYYSAYYHQIPDIKYRDIPGRRRAHNLFFEIAAETGIFGLILFAAIPVVLVRQLAAARQNWRIKRPDLAELCVALQLSIVAYLSTGIFLHLAYERYYWFLLAIAGAAVRVLRDVELAERVETVPLRRRTDMRTQTAAA